MTDGPGGPEASGRPGPADQGPVSVPARIRAAHLQGPACRRAHRMDATVRSPSATARPGTLPPGA